MHIQELSKERVQALSPREILVLAAALNPQLLQKKILFSPSREEEVANSSSKTAGCWLPSSPRDPAVLAVGRSHERASAIDG